MILNFGEPPAGGLGELELCGMIFDFGERERRGEKEGDLEWCKTILGLGDTVPVDPGD